jgi:hypothetical protein
MHEYNGKRYATAADSAKLVRADLKAAWPGVKFSVRSERSTVNVSWTDGPTTKQVEALLNKYEMGYFDGMDDSYKYTSEYVVDGVDYSVKYLFCHRDMSLEAQDRFNSLIREYRGDLEGKPEYEIDTLAYREYKAWDATTTPLPATTAELPSHLEWIEWNKGYQASLKADGLTEDNRQPTEEELAYVMPDDAPLPVPVIITRKQQREAWKVW